MRGNVRWYGTRAALLFALGLLVVVPGTARAQGWSDDFEAYTAGDPLGPQSPNWTPWDDTPAADGTVSTAQAASGSNCLDLPTDSDVVALIGGVTDGVWSISIKYFIPDTSVTGKHWLGIFDLYSNGGPKSSGYGLTFDLATGEATDGAGGTFTIVRNAWVELKFDMVDLTTNNMVVSYDGTVVNDRVGPNHNRTQIQGLDFWSDGAPDRGHAIFCKLRLFKRDGVVVVLAERVELHRCVAHLDHLQRFLGVLLRRAGVRVPAVGVDADPVRERPAQQLVYRPPQRLALQVP